MAVPTYKPLGLEVNLQTYVTRLTKERVSMLETRAKAASSQDARYGQVRIHEFDPITGNPRTIILEGSLRRSGDYAARAIQEVHRLAEVLGSESTPEFVPYTEVQNTLSGAARIFLHQRHEGIPIFEANLAVRFKPNGAVYSIVGRTVTVSQEPDKQSIVSVQQAVITSAHHLLAHLDPTQPLKVQPVIVDTHTDRNSPSILAANPFGDNIAASRVWFPASNGLRLGWDIILMMPKYLGQYRVIIDTKDGRLLYCRSLDLAALAQANVYRTDPISQRTLETIPVPDGSYNLPLPGWLPNGFPDPWVETNMTVGNSVAASSKNIFGQIGRSVTGAINHGVVVFDASDPLGVDQQVTNLFYYCCYMHDFFYLLGFNEAKGNLQESNFGRGGKAGDRLQVYAVLGPVPGGAQTTVAPDGSTVVINAGQANGLPTALDSYFIYHEYVHAVVGRRVAGGNVGFALQQPQGKGMNEGWGDYYACTVNGTDVWAPWIAKNPNKIISFDRTAPYNSSYPHNYGDLGTPPFDMDEHRIGEIWAATLLEMNRNLLREGLGFAFGPQLVFDAMGMAASEPSFLDGRNDLLQELDHRQQTGLVDTVVHGKARFAVWTAFARFGMGIDAHSPIDAGVVGVIADFKVPAPPKVTAVIPDHGQTAGGDPVTVKGTGFTDCTIVYFQSVPVSPLAGGTDTELSVLTPPHIPGDIDITVETPFGTSDIVPADVFTYLAPPPVVTALRPNSGSFDGGTSVVIFGSTFAGTTDVQFGRALARIHSIDDTQILVTAPPCHIVRAPGTSNFVQVHTTVTTPSGISAEGTRDVFTYGVSPAVQNIRPDRGVEAGGISVTITGTGFLAHIPPSRPSVIVRFGSIVATKVSLISDNQITVESPAGTGAVHVTVETVFGMSAPGQMDLFNYLPRPAITNVVPNAGPIAGGTSVAIFGSGFFEPGLTVRFGSVFVASNSIQSNPAGNKLTVTSPPGNGTVHVNVTTSGGASANSPQDQFSYMPEPAISGVSPVRGGFAGGTAVTISGSGFLGTSAVKFGPTPASFTIASDNQIVAMSPPSSAGAAAPPLTVEITVLTPGGSSATGPSQKDHFTYIGAPRVDWIDPQQGSGNGGTAVGISGTNFSDATGVGFGLTGAAFEETSPNDFLQARSPPGSGTVHVTVITPYGTSAGGPNDEFTYFPPPVLTAISPNTGTYGTQFTLSGSGFSNAEFVYFRDSVGITGADFYIASDIEIAGEVPALGTGVYEVIVKTAIETSNSVQFKYS